MVRSIHIDHFHQPAGLAGFARATGNVKPTAVGGIMSLLVAAGSIAVHAAVLLRHTFVAWAEARQQREDARRLREAADGDSRLREDLVSLQQYLR